MRGSLVVGDQSGFFCRSGDSWIADNKVMNHMTLNNDNLYHTRPPYADNAA